MQVDSDYEGWYREVSHKLHTWLYSITYMIEEYVPLKEMHNFLSKIYLFRIRDTRDALIMAMKEQVICYMARLMTGEGANVCESLIKSKFSECNKNRFLSA